MVHFSLKLLSLLLITKNDLIFPIYSSHITMGFDGVEFFVNSSGSYTEIRKCWQSLDFIKAATSKSGGCYLFANQKGCDGN